MVKDFNWKRRHRSKDVRAQLQDINDFAVAGGGGGGGMPENPLAIEHGGTGSKTLAEAKIALEIPEALPTITADDDGKALTADNGKWIAKDIPAELPEVESTDEGLFLGVDANGNWEALDIPAELPAATVADSGKVATVADDASIKWADMPSGLPEVTALNENQVLTANADLSVSWKDAPEELPEHETTDEGKVLGIDANGDVAWDYPAEQVPTPTTDDANKALYAKADGTYELKKTQVANAEGVLPLANGGTGASTLEDAKKNLEIPELTVKQETSDKLTFTTYGQMAIVSVKDTKLSFTEAEIKNTGNYILSSRAYQFPQGIKGFKTVGSYTRSSGNMQLFDASDNFVGLVSYECYIDERGTNFAVSFNRPDFALTTDMYGWFEASCPFFLEN